VFSCDFKENTLSAVDPVIGNDIGAGIPGIGAGTRPADLDRV